jgi:putative ABC transport system ATP-binding protein
MRGVTKFFEADVVRTRALAAVDLEIAAGESVAIVGRSGSGKTTLLNVIGLIESLDAGTYELNGTATHALRDRELARLRNQHIGFVYQTFNLIPELTVAENVELPLRFRDSTGSRERRRMVTELLEKLGLAGRAGHRPAQLSGGQQQRVAIARAIVTRPSLLLADEPTGNLDSEMAQAVLALLREIQAGGTTLVVVTHDVHIAASFRRVVEMRDGRLVPTQAAAA